MRRLSPAIIPILLAPILLGLVGGPVLSQPSPPARTSISAAMDRVDRHINSLHRQLAITPAQQPQWDSFAAIMRANARRMEEAHNAEQPGGVAPNAIADMRAYAASIRVHAEDVDRLLPAFEALYATMTPEQRAKADKLFQQARRDFRKHGPT